MSFRIDGERLLLAFLVLCCALYALTPIHNGNFFWHLRNGEDILRTGEIRTTDPFTHTMKGQRWVQQEWLAEVLFAATWLLLGEAGPVLLKALVVALAVVFSLLAARGRGASAAACVLMGVAWLSLSQPRWLVRPHVFSIGFFGLYLWLVPRLRSRPVLSLAVFVPLQITWVNTHAGFVMGIFLLALPVVDDLLGGRLGRAARSALLPFVALLCSGVHPNGFGSILYLREFLSRPLFRESIWEWWSPFDPRYQPGLPLSRTAIVLSLLIAAAVVLIIVRRKRLVRSHVVGIGVLSAASVFAARNVDFFSLACLAWLPPLVRGRARRGMAWILLASVLVVPFAYGVPREVGPPRQLGARVDWNVYPVGLADYLEDHPELLEATIVNTNEISGYLEYRFGERLPLYMDGRCPLYPQSFYAEYLLLTCLQERTALAEQLQALQARGIDIGLFDRPRNPGSSAYLMSDLPQWLPVYWDSLTVAYARTDFLEDAGLGHLAYRYVDPLRPGALLSIPPHLIPEGRARELDSASRGRRAMTVAMVAKAALHLREGDLPGALRIAGGPGASELLNRLFTALSGKPLPTGTPGFLRQVRCWSLARKGDTREALSVATDLGYHQLRSALRIILYHRTGRDTLPQAFLPLVPPSGIGSLRSGQIPAEGTMTLASALFTAGMADSALAMVDSAMGCDTVPPWSGAAAGVLLGLSGRDSLALFHTGEALRGAATPSNLYARARVERMAGRPESAVEHLKAALSAAPGYHRARLLLADCLWESGSLQASYEQYSALHDSGYPLPDHGSLRMELVRQIGPGSVDRLVRRSR
ncbi:tetratricopeptide repeat protein [Candidatus Fermentibacteria bacterium]|nr:tetratricopeptide repeat protein [Candidatus Fermentibacteria bacterium]